MLHYGLPINHISYHVHACMILSCHACIAIPFPYMHPLLCMRTTHHWHEQHCSTIAIYLSHQHYHMADMFSMFEKSGPDHHTSTGKLKRVGCRCCVRWCSLNGAHQLADLLTLEIKSYMMKDTFEDKESSTRLSAFLCELSKVL